MDGPAASFDAQKRLKDTDLASHEMPQVGVSEFYLQAGTVIPQSFIGNNRWVFDNLRVHCDHDVSPALVILNPYPSNRTKPFAVERCQVLFLNLCLPKTKL